jgi:SAM-dependent methyltransferase
VGTAMMSLETQIMAGVLVCPLTKEKLQIGDSNGALVCRKTNKSYKLLDGRIPLLLIDEQWANQYIGDSDRMVQEYASDKMFRQDTFIDKLRKSVNELYAGGIKSKKASSALSQLFEDQEKDFLCLSIGGGPSRVHPCAVNVNIGPFPNVDVVADAHLLPYADDSVDAICCAAVIEHLSNPIQAVKEMHRVLKPNGIVFADTPFLQEYHGYPHHYQNLTLTGHEYLFQSNGFEIMDSGASLGPFYVIVHFISVMITEFLPKLLAKILGKLWFLLGTLFLLPLDKFFVNHKNAYVLASGTFVLARKPISSKT